MSTPHETWHLRSFKDRDTHLAAVQRESGIVVAVCGEEFQPMATLSGAPLDSEQVCPACRQ
ncbi:MAG: hypothetical protein ACRDRO_13885 [Pseudonocardiaceae bacterium]